MARDEMIRTNLAHLRLLHRTRRQVLEPTLSGHAVYLMKAADVAPQYRTNIVVWDDVCAWEARLDAYSNVTSNLFSYSPLDLKRCGDIVDTLLVQAREAAGT
jgi:hypothetical protein